ncbi:MAG TPA: carbohydrate ABC transporter permease [Chloroflexota bacterium]|nr:carbohydrate ABC transporter permease [Chloroflexota bacterium]
MRGVAEPLVARDWTRAIRPPTPVARVLTAPLVAGALGRYLAYGLIFLIFTVPFVWMALGAFRNEQEIFRYVSPLQVRTFVPVEWTLQNFVEIFRLGFGRFLLNSIAVSSAVVASSLIFNTMAAYFFARLEFPLKGVLFVLVIATMLVPFEATIVPLYLVVRVLGLQDSYAGLIVPWYASPFVIFALAQFFREIPRELDEAAIIDGCGRLGVLRHVIVPNAVPALVTMALLEFQNIWNLFFWPLIVTSKPELMVIQVAIVTNTSPEQIYWGRTFASSVLASLPVIMLFLSLQRYYIRGAVLSGLKG